MGIKRSTLYYQRKININKKQKELRIRKKIEDISREHPYYGYRRITASLRRDQLIVNHKKVLKIMKELGIQGRIKRKYITPIANTIIKYTLIWLKIKKLPVLTKSGVRISPISGSLTVLSIYQPS